MIAHNDMTTETFNSRRIPWLGWLHSGGLTRQYCPLQHCPYRKSLVGDHHHQHPLLSLVHKFLSHYYLTKAPSPQMTFMSVTFMNASVPLNSDRMLCRWKATSAGEVVKDLALWLTKDLSQLQTKKDLCGLRLNHFPPKGMILHSINFGHSIVRNKHYSQVFLETESRSP